MSVPTIVKLQIGLSAARLVFYIVGLAVAPPVTGSLWIVPSSIGCLNDLFLLTLDFFIYGNIFVTVVMQHLVSSMLSAFSIIYLGISVFPVYLSVPAFLLNLSCLILSTRIMTLKPRSSWVLGIKDVEYYRAQSNIKRPRLSVFGIRRPSDDEVRKIPGHIWAGMKVVTFRRREGMESLQFSVIRNITAILLLLGLAAQTTYLFYKVVDGKSIELREVWDQLSFDDVPSLIQDVSVCYNYSSQWLMYVADASSRNFSWGDQLKHPGPGCSMAFANPGSFTSGYVHIGITNLTTQSPPSPMWLQVSNFDATSAKGSSNDGIEFAFEMIPGSYLIGLIDISYRKKIFPSFMDKLGITRQYESFPLLSVDWITSIPLDDTTIAQASLSFSQRAFDLSYKFKIIQDVRVNTFLGALSSIGGLLAVLQGLHLFCFGMPLFWGLSGARLLNPFGLFGSGTSREVRRRMIARYGLIPGNSSNANVHGLSLFLSEFVLNFGPLSGECDSEAKVIQQAEEGEMVPSVERVSLLPISSGVEERAPLGGVTNQRRSNDIATEVSTSDQHAVI